MESDLLDLPLLQLADGRTASLRQALHNPNLPPLAGKGYQDAALYRLLLALRRSGEEGPLDCRHFMQTEGLEDAPIKPWNAISFERPWQSTAIYRHHGHWNRPDAISAVEFWRSLLAFFTFAPSAGRSRTGHTGSGPLAGRLALILEGATLGETLDLLDEQFTEADGPVPWREQVHADRLYQGSYRGALDRLVPRTRAFRVYDGMLQMEAGFRYEGKDDPMTAPLRYSEDRPPYGPWLALEVQDQLHLDARVVAVRIAGPLLNKAAVKGLVDSRAPRTEVGALLAEVRKTEKSMSALERLELRMRIGLEVLEAYV